MRMIRFFAATVMWVLLGSISVGYSGGDGSAANPYQIATKADLLTLAATTADYDKNFIMTADIDLDPNLPGGQIFTTAIIAPDTESSDGAFQGTVFTGVLDGANHKIVNFTLHGGNNNFLGLFGCLELGSEIINLGLENCNVIGDSSESKCVGGLAGWSHAALTQCYVTGIVTGFNTVGGLVGFADGGLGAFGDYGDIRQCHVNGNIFGHESVGGLVGFSYGRTTKCYTSGAVTGDAYSMYIGGLVGTNYGVMRFNFATGSVFGYYDVGGLIGHNYNYDGKIINCYATGTVSSGSDAYYPSIGGLIGENESDYVSGCFASGSVFCESQSAFVGGLIGYSFGAINNCYASGHVIGNGLRSQVGGLMGRYDSYPDHTNKIHNCYSTGLVSSSDPYTATGGLVGVAYANMITKCYWDVQTSGQTTSPHGVGLSTAQMKRLSTFISAGWDFTNETANGTNDYWRMCVDGVDYPRLNWESIDGDFACPDGVNTEDLDYFVGRWMLENCTSSNNYCGGVDMDVSGDVDLGDWAIFAGHWLEGI